MVLKLPGSLILTLTLLGVGFAGGGASLAVQRWQTRKAADAAAHELTGGDAQLGKAVFSRHGCGACHAIQGLDGADGEVGPALDKIAVRGFLAGSEPNDPQHMIAWVQHPQALEPGVGMPEMGLTDAEARNVAAYLYTLR
jgi:cytochrome c